MNGYGALIAFLGALVTVHALKFVVYWAKNGFKRPLEALRRGLRSGGMPSGHTADMVALSTYLGLWQGFDSAIFALAVGVTIIVMYDAMNVRYAVGKMGAELNRVSGKKMRVYEGHTLPQVIVGALVGVAVGLGFFALLQGC